MIDISSLTKKLVQQEKNSQNKIETVNKSTFRFLYVIGKGGFGRVWKIKSKKTGEIFALKEMSKVKIIDKKSEKSINSERIFLSKLHHPFIINMHYAFQDRDNLYLVMDMLSGGDLRYHVTRYRKFSEEQTRFFIANIIFALEYIHANNVIHRDIKPENLVLDSNGYVRVTDFGIAKENCPDNSNETSGTPGYMAPEVIISKNHSFSVDYYAVGIIGYEFMLGKRPYNGKDRKQIKEQMLSKEAVIKSDMLTHGWSQESADFINLLLQRKEEKRLGSKNGAQDLYKHPWLKYYPWPQLKSKQLLAPFIPEKNNDNFDKMYCESIEKISEQTKMRYEDILCDEEFDAAFDEFYFNENEERKKREKEAVENREKDGEKEADFGRNFGGKKEKNKGKIEGSDEKERSVEESGEDLRSNDIKQRSCNSSSLSSTNRSVNPTDLPFSVKKSINLNSYLIDKDQAPKTSREHKNNNYDLCIKKINAVKRHSYHYITLIEKSQA